MMVYEGGGGARQSAHIAQYFIITLSVSVPKLRTNGWLRTKYTLTLLHRKLNKSVLQMRNPRTENSQHAMAAA
jgi:hypothetical protein